MKGYTLIIHVTRLKLTMTIAINVLSLLVLIGLLSGSDGPLVSGVISDYALGIGCVILLIYSHTLVSIGDLISQIREQNEQMENFPTIDLMQCCVDREGNMLVADEHFTKMFGKVERGESVLRHFNSRGLLDDETCNALISYMEQIKVGGIYTANLWVQGRGTSFLYCLKVTKLDDKVTKCRYACELLFLGENPKVMEDM